MVEGARLEFVYMVNAVSRVRIPSSPPVFSSRKFLAGFLDLHAKCLPNSTIDRACQSHKVWINIYEKVFKELSFEGGLSARNSPCSCLQASSFIYKLYGKP